MPQPMIYKTDIVARLKNKTLPFAEASIKRENFIYIKLYKHIRKPLEIEFVQLWGWY